MFGNWAPKDRSQTSAIAGASAGLAGRISIASSSATWRSANRQEPSRVVDGHRSDRRVVHAALAQPRQEGLDEVPVAVAAVMRELLVVADVLAQQDPLGVAALQERQQEIDDPWLAPALHRRERHAEEVELNASAALHDREVVRQPRVGIGVADDDS